jgi:hypothetical protein
LSADYGGIAGGASDTQSVEGDVPSELFPVSAREVFTNPARDSSGLENCSQFGSARTGPALKLTEDDLAMVNVMNQAGLQAVQANETEPAQNLFRGHELRELLFVAQAILQGEDSGCGSNEGRQQVAELAVGGGLQADDDQVAGADLLWCPGAPGPDMEIALRAANRDALAAHNLVIGAEQEMEVVAGAGELCAIKASYGPTANDGDAHRKT